MRLTLKKKIFFPPIILIAIFGITMYFFSNTQIVDPLIINKLNADHALGYSLLNEKYPGEWVLKDGKLFKGEKLMNDNTEFVDEIKRRTGSEATIFLDNVRVATSVLKEGGLRAVGTKVAAEVENAVIRGGKEFIGQAIVVGKPFQTKYTTIKDKDGKTIGMWFVGVSRHEVRAFNIIMGIFVAVTIVIGLLIFSLISTSITKQIQRISTSLRESAKEVFGAASQVSSASQSLAEGTSEQAAGIEETSSSIEEMSSMTRQNADNANQANILMAETSHVVNEANRSMTELTESMKEISAASEETAKIIKTIDEIAFQTNLLALNAAVEAARAGEAGAGFAVVADEVRNLAMRAADAAKNTANLIERTVKKIKSGSEIVLKTNEAFAKVAGGAKKVGELVGEISAASNEQSQGIEQINKAVAEMDKVIQKNAASAEESAAAAEQMNEQAGQMKGHVAELVFMVSGQRNGNAVGSGNDQRRIGIVSGQRPVIDHNQETGGKRTLTTITKKAKGMEGIIRHKVKEVRSGQVIPMEESDFKEF